MSNPSISVVHHDSPMNNNISEGQGRVVRRGGVRLLRPRNLSILPLTMLRLPQAKEGRICVSRASILPRSSMAKAARCRRARGQAARREDWQAHPGTGRDRQAQTETGVDRPTPGHDGGGVGDHVQNARAVGKSLRQLAGRTTADETVKASYRELTARGIPTARPQHWSVLPGPPPPAPQRHPCPGFR